MHFFSPLFFVVVVMEEQKNFLNMLRNKRIFTVYIIFVDNNHRTTVSNSRANSKRLSKDKNKDVAH